MAVYAHRDDLKTALALPANSTDKHSLLDAALEAVSRQIDQYCGFRFYPASGVRYLEPRDSVRLALDYPLTNIDSVTLDTDGDASYESTLDSTAYYTVPANASAETPAAPYWGLNLRPNANASCAFPVGVERGAKVQGTWGYYDQRTEVAARPATGITAADTVWDMTGASALHPGQTVRVDSEQVLITRNALSGSDTDSASGQITVVRAQGGTVGSTHSSNSTMSVYVYPIVDRACLIQAEMDYRAMDAPLGTVVGDMGGGPTVQAPGGLHPFTRRMLDQFREPVAQ